MFRFLQKNSQQISSWDQAQKHAKATLVGRPIKSDNIQNADQYCQCCGHAVQKQPMPLCQNTKELQFIGVGFPLYFVFFKYCIILMFLQSVCIGIAGLSYAIQNNYDFCINHHSKIVPNLNKKAECQSYYVYFANVGDYVPKQIVILRIVDFLITIAFFIYMRDQLIKLIGYYDERNTTFSDYSIIIKYLPQKDRIKQALNNVLKDHQVHCMVILGPFQHIQKMQRELEQTRKQKKKFLQTIQDNSSKIKELHDALDLLQCIEIKIEKLQRSFLEALINEQKSYLDGQIVPQSIIISFQTDQAKQQILKNMQKKNQILIPQGWSLQQFKKIEVIQCPQPRDIIWQNLSISRKSKYKSRMMGWTLTFAILIVISIIFYFALNKVAYMIEHQSQSNHKATANVIFYLLQVLIIFINKFLLSPILHKVSHTENYFTKTSEEYSYSLKYLLSMFFTSALMTVLVEAITHKNIYAHSFGVVDSQSVMILLNSFMIPLIWLINPWALFKKAKQCYYRSKNYLSQAEANQLMEQIPYTMGKRYAQIVKLVWLVSLYGSLIPWGYFSVTFGLGLYYWTDKYNLLRRSSVKEQISGELTLKIMSLLQFALVLQCCGDLFFDLQIRYQYSIASIVCLSIGVVYIILPKNSIIGFIHGEKFQDQDKRLDECIGDLGSSYSDLHPILGKNMNNYIASLKIKYQQADLLYQSRRQYFSNKKISQFSMIKQNQSPNHKLKAFKKQFIAQNQKKQNLLETEMVQIDVEKSDLKDKPK